MTNQNNDMSQLKFLEDFVLLRDCDIELVFIAFTIMMIIIRHDVYSLIYTSILCVSVFTQNRKFILVLWYILGAFGVISIIVQYLLTFDIFTPFCTHWFFESNDENKIIFSCLGLPFYYEQQKLITRNLICDFIVLTIVISQIRRFRIDSNDNSNTSQTIERDIGTSNRQFHSNLAATYYTDVVRFITYTSLWLYSTIALIVATEIPTPFSFGYLVIAYSVLWIGTDLFVSSQRKTIFLWNCFISYNLVVILCKINLAIFGCIFEDYFKNNLSFCAKLFNSVCYNQKYVVHDSDDINAELKDDEDKICYFPKKNVDIMWGGILFIIAILQRHVFRTRHYLFMHHDVKIESELAHSVSKMLDEVEKKNIKQLTEVDTYYKNKVEKYSEKIKQLQKTQLENKENLNHFFFTYIGYIYLSDNIDEESFVSSLYAEDESKYEKERYLTFMEIIDVTINFGIEMVLNTSGERKNKPNKISAVHKDVTFRSSESKTKNGRQKNEDTVRISFLRSFYEFIITLLVFSMICGRSIVVTLILFLNELSENYSYVIRYASQQKQALLRTAKMNSTTPTLLTSDVNGTDSSTRVDDDDDDEISSFLLIRLLQSLYRFHLIYFKVVCYLLACVLMIDNPNISNLPLPFMVFFWGTLCIPNPSKMFWLSMLIYTQILIALKLIIQLRILEWSVIDDSEIPLRIIRLLGLDRQSRYHCLTYEMLLLIALFYNRSILRRLGLWDDDERGLIGFNKSTELSNRKLFITEIVGSSGKFNDFRRKSIMIVSTFWNNLFGFRYVTAKDYSLYMWFFSITNVFAYISNFPDVATSTGVIVKIVTEKTIPVDYFVVITVQIFILIIDRSLFLRRNLRGKIYFHLSSILWTHVWLFFYLPLTKEELFIIPNQLKAAYISECCYLLYSAAQIRVGFPKKIFYYLYCKNYSYIISLLMDNFRTLPFISEVWFFLEWCWLNTCLTFREWYYAENIFMDIYLQKAMYLFYKRYPTYRGESRPFVEKFFLGYLNVLFLFIMLIIPFYTYYFDIINYDQFIPLNLKMSFGFYSSPPLFTVSSNMIKSLPDDILGNESLKMPETADIFVATLSVYSASFWQYSAGNESVTELVRASRQGYFFLKIEIDGYVERDGDKIHIINETAINLTSDVIPKLLGTLYNASAKVELADVLPKILTIQNVDFLWHPFSYDYSNNYKVATDRVNIQLSRLSQQMDDSYLGILFRIELNRTDKKYSQIIHSLPVVIPDDNDKIFNVYIFSSCFSRIGLYGLIRLVIYLFLYLSFVVKYILPICVLNFPPIRTNAMPYPDRILTICLDMRLAREYNALHLEEALYAKLIYIYRSPHLLIEWTRQPDEKAVCEPESVLMS